MLNLDIKTNSSWIQIITNKIVKNVSITPITVLFGTLILIISAKIKGTSKSIKLNLEFLEMRIFIIQKKRTRQVVLYPSCLPMSVNYVGFV